MRKLKMWSLWLVVTTLFIITAQVICTSKALAEEKVKHEQVVAKQTAEENRLEKLQLKRWTAIQQKLEEEQRAEQERQKELAREQEIALERAEAEQRKIELEKARQEAQARQQINRLKPLVDYTGLPVEAVDFMVKECQNKQVPVEIVVGLIEKESTFDPHAVNPSSGAAGLGQLEDNTAPTLAAKAGVAYSRSSLFEPTYNLRLVIVYLDYLRSQTGDWDAALTAYNRGLGGYQAYRQATGTSASSYSRSVLSNAEKARAVTGAI